MAQTVAARCSNCLAQLEKRLWQVEGKKTVFCDMKCYSNYQKRTSESMACENCGTLFLVIASRKGKARFCSRLCAGYRPKVEMQCGHCGETFRASCSEARSGRAKYCSKACHYDSYPLRYLTDQGYFRISVGNRGARKYEFEHRIIMAGMIGRPMRDGETVHHRNGIRHDNRPENLEFRVGKHGAGATHHCATCTCQ